MKFLLSILGLCFLVSCTVEKNSVREGYKICQGKFLYEGQQFRCSSSYKFNGYSVDVRVLPTVIEDKGLVEKGPFKIIVVVNYVAVKKPQLDFGKSLLLVYESGILLREISLNPGFDFEGRRCFEKSGNEHCHVTKTLVERINLNIKVEDAVVVVLKLKREEKMSEPDSLIYNFVPYREVKKLKIPLVSV